MSSRNVARGAAPFGKNPGAERTAPTPPIAV